MNLSKKKKLAKRTFNVGEDRIIFVESRIQDIAEAITKQDMRDLKEQGAIIIKGAKGRRKSLSASSTTKRTTGKIRKRLNKRKKNYVKLVRKLRKYISGLKKSKRIDTILFKEIRKKIKNSEFRSLSHLKSYLKDTKNISQMPEAQKNEDSKKKKKRK